MCVCGCVTLTLTSTTLPLLSPTHRYRLTLKHEDAALAARFPSLDMDDTSALSQCKVSANTRLVWKDLGPQIGYAYVFVFPLSVSAVVSLTQPHP